jgi:hypothetical protein
MKKQSIHVIKPIIHSKFIKVTIALLIIANIAAAQTKAVAIMEPVANMAVVKHLGNPSGNMLFQVQYDNFSGDKFSLTIKDNDGAVLFQDIYTDKKFDKKFQLPKGEADKLKITIRSGRNNIQNFEINTSSRVVEEIIVKKVG